MVVLLSNGHFLILFGTGSFHIELFYRNADKLVLIYPFSVGPMLSLETAAKALGAISQK